MKQEKKSINANKVWIIILSILAGISTTMSIQSSEAVALMIGALIIAMYDLKR